MKINEGMWILYPSLLSIYTHCVHTALMTVAVLRALPHVVHLEFLSEPTFKTHLLASHFTCLPSKIINIINIMPHNVDIFQIRAYLLECFSQMSK